jgi:hypothetical protein
MRLCVVDVGASVAKVRFRASTSLPCTPQRPIAPGFVVSFLANVNAKVPSLNYICGIFLAHVEYGVVGGARGICGTALAAAAHTAG